MVWIGSVFSWVLQFSLPITTSKCQLSFYAEKSDDVKWNSKSDNCPFVLEVAMNGDDDDDSNDTGYGSKKSPEDESVVPEAESDEEEEEDVSEDGTHRLFSFHMVNSYGSAEMDGIRDDGKPIKFSSESALNSLVILGIINADSTFKGNCKHYGLRAMNLTIFCNEMITLQQ